jgi:nuclear pore complex protein Nup133
LHPITLFTSHSFSWDAIDDTIGVSDLELKNRIRSTALYGTLHTLTARGDNLNEYVRSPDEALMTPGVPEITSRWPGMSAEQVTDLLQDYDLERDKLGELKLDDMFPRVRELVEEDVMWNSSS